MVVLRFAMENLRKKPKDSYFFAFTMFAASTIITLFFSIINNPNYGNSQTSFSNYADLAQAFDGGVGDGLFSMMLCFLMIFVCILVVFFANKFFLLSKLSDIGVMSISGCNIIKISWFMIFQNLVVSLIAVPIGSFVGFAAHPLINYLIYQQMAMEAPLFSFNLSAIGYCLFTFGMICFWLILTNIGFVYRLQSITSMFKARKSMNPIGKQKNAFLKAVFVGIYFFTLYFLLGLDGKLVNFIFMIYVGMAVYLGAANVFRYVFPDIITYIKDHSAYTHKHLKIALANLRYSIINGNLLVTIILLSISVLFFYLCKFRHDPVTFMVVFIAYIVNMFLICICLGYKLSADALAKRSVFRNLMSIGYLKSDIKQIIHYEVGGFFALILIICLPLLSVIAWIFVGHEITLMFMLFMLCIFTIMIILTALMMNLIYARLIIGDDLTNLIREE